MLCFILILSYCVHAAFYGVLKDTTSDVCVCGSVAQWLGRWTCDWRSRVQSQPLRYRVRHWTSCSHTLSSASEVTTLWRYINQFKI